MLSSRASTVIDDLTGEEPDATLTLVSGALAVASPGALDLGRVLDQAVAPGSYPVHVHMSEQELDAEPTAGVDGIWLRLGEAPVTRWQEAMTAAGDPLVDEDDLVGLCLGDAETFASEDDLGDEIRTLFDEDCTTDGFGSVEDKAVVVYVGEVAVEHRFYCGFDDAGELVALVGVFRYPNEEAERRPAAPEPAACTAARAARPARGKGGEAHGGVAGRQ